MFLKTSKDMSVLVSIYSVEALFTCKKKKNVFICSADIYWATNLSLGVWGGGMVVEDKDTQEFVHSS